MLKFRQFSLFPILFLAKGGIAYSSFGQNAGVHGISWQILSAELTRLLAAQAGEGRGGRDDSG